MKRKGIFFLTSFHDLEPFYVANKDQLRLFANKFENVFIVNCENLKIFNKEESFSKNIKSKFPKKIKFANPKNFFEFDYLCRQNNPLIINNIGRGYEFFKILFYLRKKKIPQVLIGHIGNIQFSTYYWHNINFKIFIFFFTRFLPRLITRLFVILKIFSPIDVRFVSNKLVYNNFKKNSQKTLSIPSYYKEIILVKSKIYDNFAKYNEKLSEKYILLLDMQPEYRSMQDIKILDEKLIDRHYRELNDFLSNLSKKLKKKAVVSIHPGYDLKKTQERFKKFKVIKFKTKELIKSAYLILFFDTSAILPAFILKKKVICLRANLFKGKRYNSDLYKDLLKLKSLKIDRKITFNKKKFIKDLNNRTKSYEKYLNNYTSSNLNLSGTESILKYIRKRYFSSN